MKFAFFVLTSFAVKNKKDFIYEVCFFCSHFVRFKK